MPADGGPPFRLRENISYIRTLLNNESSPFSIHGLFKAGYDPFRPRKCIKKYNSSPPIYSKSTIERCLSSRATNRLKMKQVLFMGDKAKGKGKDQVRHGTCIYSGQKQSMC